MDEIDTCIIILILGPVLLRSCRKTSSLQLTFVFYAATGRETAKNKKNESRLQSVSWILAEFYFNRGLQRLYTGTCIILQKTINGFLCLLIVFLKSKTYQLILKDVIKLNRNLR